LTIIIQLYNNESAIILYESGQIYHKTSGSIIHNPMHTCRIANVRLSVDHVIQETRKHKVSCCSLFMSCRHVTVSDISLHRRQQTTTLNRSPLTRKTKTADTVQPIYNKQRTRLC